MNVILKELFWGQGCHQDLETQAQGHVLPKVWKLLVEKSFPPSVVVIWEKTVSHELYELFSGNLRPTAAQKI